MRPDLVLISVENDVMDNPSSRTLVLLSLLQTQRAWTASELARRLDVAERTVRRDISRLRSLGYDIRSMRGPGGTYRLVPSIKIPPCFSMPTRSVPWSRGCWSWKPEIRARLPRPCEQNSSSSYHRAYVAELQRPRWRPR